MKTRAEYIKLAEDNLEKASDPTVAHGEGRQAYALAAHGYIELAKLAGTTIPPVSNDPCGESPPRGLIAAKPELMRAACRLPEGHSGKHIAAQPLRPGSDVSW